MRALAVLLPIAAAAAQGRVDFAAQVLPVLKERCFSCHASRESGARVGKPKGGLRLDGVAWMLRGGEGGAALTPGSANQSPIYTRTALPADHDDRMPAKGDPLTLEQRDVLRRWIDEGADFGDWKGATDLPAPELPAPPAQPQAASGWDQLITELSAGVSPVSPDTLGKLQAGGRLRIAPLSEDCPLLRVDLVGADAPATDDDLRALASIRGNIAVFSAARSALTDRGCGELARLPRLVALDLRQTAVGDAGVSRLTSLARLRSLNLFATGVGDGAIASLARMAALQEVHLWQSKVSTDGMARLHQQRPDLRVVGAPDLPAPEAPAAGRATDRRRR